VQLQSLLRTFWSVGRAAAISPSHLLEPRTCSCNLSFAPFGASGVQLQSPLHTCCSVRRAAAISPSRTFCSVGRAAAISPSHLLQRRTCSCNLPFAPVAASDVQPMLVNRRPHIRTFSLFGRRMARVGVPPATARHVACQQRDTGVAAMLHHLDGLIGSCSLHEPSRYLPETAADRCPGPGWSRSRRRAPREPELTPRELLLMKLPAELPDQHSCPATVTMPTR
jgi:hypothetical protein